METFKLRIAGEADAEALLAVYAPYVEHTAITFEYQTPTVEDFRGRICRTLERYPYLAAELDGELVGYAYAGPFHDRAAYDWAVETSVYVQRDLRRLGVGRALYAALENILALQNILNLNACIAVPTTPQDPHLTRDSVAFHEHLGYRLVGQFHQCGYKFDRWYDMAWMEKHIGDHTVPQPPVRPFGDIRDLVRTQLEIE